MLEPFKAKYTSQTLFDIAAHDMNPDYKKEDHARLRNIEDQIIASTDIEDLSEYIDALINEIDFSILNTDEFLNSIDDSHYNLTHLFTGLDIYKGYYMKTDWQSCRNAVKFISHILIMSKHWAINDSDFIFKDEQSKQKYYA